MQVQIAVDTFRLLADLTRLRLLWLLSSEQYDVGTLAARLGVARVSTSNIWPGSAPAGWSPLAARVAG